MPTVRLVPAPAALAAGLAVLAAGLAVLAAVVVLVAPSLPAAAAGPTRDGPDPVAAVRLALPADDGTLTPYTFTVAYPLVTLVYDTLLWRDPDGVPRPWLAESVDTSADGLTVTIRLRDGARWHDGRPVTAADVGFTFGYVAERFHPRFTPQLDAVETVRAVDDATAEITLARPAAGFADQPLADLPILPAHLWADLPADAAAPPGPPIGSGPYRLAGHTPGQGYRFDAVSDYMLGAPLVDAVEVTVIDAFDDMLAALRRGDVDMVPVSLPPGVDPGPTVAVARGPAYAGTMLLLNTRRAPFDDPAVRRAVAGALDLGRIAGMVGEAGPADRGFVHPASRWAPGEPVHATDPDAAAQALAGVPALTVLAPAGDPVRHEAARQVALALTRAGVDAEVDALAAGALARAVGQDDTDGDEPDYDAAVWPIPPLASHDPDFLAVVFGSEPDRAVLNYTGYASDEFDALARAVATTRDPAKRQTAIDEQAALLAADAPAVPLLFAEGAFAHRPGAYDGWVYVDGSGILDKRSFLALDERPARPASGAPEHREPATARQVPGPLGLAALALLALAIVLAAVELARRR